MPSEPYAAFVALDWGDRSHAFAWQVADEPTLTQGSFAATPEALHGWLAQLQHTCAGRPVALAVEAGQPALLQALHAVAWLTVYCVHPATSAGFRKTCTPSGAKDDGPDAVMLLRLLRQHRDLLTPFSLDPPATQQLRALVTARRAAVDQRSRVANQLRSGLKRYYPQALSLVGEDLTAPLAWAFLRRFPELALVQRARPATLRAFYHAHHVRSATQIAARLALAAQAQALVTDPVLIAAARLEVAHWVDLLASHSAHIVRLERCIAAAFAAHPHAGFFAALPGAGPALAPRLLVAFGAQPDRYPAAAALQKYAGVAPVREKSGHHLWVHWRWHAPKFLRQTFVEWAGQTVPRCAWAQAYYRQQAQAGKGRHAILRALAFKWIRILWRCWQDHQPYDEARYLAALQRHHSPYAPALTPT